MDWITYSFASILLLGISMSLYKMPTFNGYSSLHSTFWSNTFSLLIVSICFFVFAQDTSISEVSWYGLAWGVAFALTMAQQKLLLKRMETNTLLPVTSSAGNTFAVLMGIVLFHDKITVIQTIGIFIIILSIFLYSRKNGGLILDANSISLGLGIILSGTVAKLIQKLGALDNIFHFAVYQFLGAALSSFALIYIFEKSSIKDIFKISKIWKVSLIIALSGSVAGYALLKALSLAPFALVIGISPLYVVVTSILGVYLYKEKMTSYKIILMSLAILGVILVKIG